MDTKIIIFSLCSPDFHKISGIQLMMNYKDLCKVMLLKQNISTLIKKTNTIVYDTREKIQKRAEKEKYKLFKKARKNNSLKVLWLPVLYIEG